MFVNFTWGFFGVEGHVPPGSAPGLSYAHVIHLISYGALSHAVDVIINFYQLVSYS